MPLTPQEVKDYYKPSLDFAEQKGHISTAMVQWNLGISYTKAAEVIDLMESRGAIEKGDGNTKRKYIGGAQ